MAKQYAADDFETIGKRLREIANRRSWQGVDPSNTPNNNDDYQDTLEGLRAMCKDHPIWADSRSPNYYKFVAKTIKVLGCSRLSGCGRNLTFNCVKTGRCEHN